MSITLNFAQQEATLDFDGKTLTKPLETLFKTVFTLSSSIIFVHGDDKIFRIDWKLWNNIEQFVELVIYDGKKWTPTTLWSYVAECTEIKCSGVQGFNLRVVGCPYGDWNSVYSSSL